MSATSTRPHFSPGAIARDIHANRHAYTMAAAASFGGMLFGWDTGLIGGVLGMSSFKNSFNLTHYSSGAYANLQGNIVSVLQAGCFFGAAFSMWASSRLGRRNAMLVAVIFFLLGSIVQTCAGINSTSLATLYVGRVIGGFGVGLISAVVPTYISESAPPKIRGRCVAAYQLFNVTGIALAYWTNYGLSLHVHPTLNPAMWRISFGLQMLPGIFCGLALLTQYESPRWLVENGRYDQAVRAMAYLRCTTVDDPIVIETTEEIRRDFEARPKMPLIDQFKFACSSKTMFYRASIGMIVMAFQQWTGTNSINYYTPQIFQSLGLTNAGLFATGVYGCVKMAATGTGLALAVDQAGRKRCLVFGGIAQGIAMWWIGIYQAVHGSRPTDNWSYTAIVAVYLYAVFYSFGWGTIPWAVATEVTPNQIRPVAMGLALMSQWLFNFTIARVTPPMLDHIPHGGTFMFFGAFLFVMAIWAVFFLPETRGTHLEETGELFSGGFSAVVKRSIQHFIHTPNPHPKETTNSAGLVGATADPAVHRGDVESSSDDNEKERVEHDDIHGA